MGEEAFESDIADHADKRGVRAIRDLVSTKTRQRPWRRTLAQVGTATSVTGGRLVSRLAAASGDFGHARSFPHGGKGGEVTDVVEGGRGKTVIESCLATVAQGRKAPPEREPEVVVGERGGYDT